jgi:hypothetical protein
MLPKYFTVSNENGEQYKLFQNTIYKMSDDFSVNVIWPIDNAVPRSLVTKLTPEVTRSCLIRSWNGQDFYNCKWMYTGSSIKLILGEHNESIIAPVVFMKPEFKQTLPFNSYSFVPSSARYIEEYDTKIYTPAKIYTTEPNSIQNTRPISRDRGNIGSSVGAAVRAVVRAVVGVTPPPIQPLPSHITKIVLADAIRKNEVCPITSDDITETNATVTPCGHVFTTEAITQWLAVPSSKGLCPVCKQKC